MRATLVVSRAQRENNSTSIGRRIADGLVRRDSVHLGVYDLADSHGMVMRVYFSHQIRHGLVMCALSLPGRATTGEGDALDASQCKFLARARQATALARDSNSYAIATRRFSSEREVTKFLFQMLSQFRFGCIMIKLSRLTFHANC